MGHGADKLQRSRRAGQLWEGPCQCRPMPSGHFKGLEVTGTRSTFFSSSLPQFIGLHLSRKRTSYRTPPSHSEQEKGGLPLRTLQNLTWESWRQMG